MHHLFNIPICSKVSYYNVFHHLHTAYNTVFEMYCPKPIRCPEFQLSKIHSTELYWEQAVSVPATLNANQLSLSTRLALAIAHPNVYGGCIAMAHRDAIVIPYQFWPRMGPRRRGSWRSTDSAAAAGHFRMVSVWICYLVCLYVLLQLPRS